MTRPRVKRKRRSAPTSLRAVDVEVRSPWGLRRVSITEHKHASEVDAAASRRLEIFRGAGRRRLWSADKKATIVAESYAGAIWFAALPAGTA